MYVVSTPSGDRLVDSWYVNLPMSFSNRSQRSSRAEASHLSQGRPNTTVHGIRAQGYQQQRMQQHKQGKGYEVCIGWKPGVFPTWYVNMFISLTYNP